MSSSLTMQLAVRAMLCTLVHGRHDNAGRHFKRVLTSANSGYPGSPLYQWKGAKMTWKACTLHRDALAGNF
jgi:hypothetical protein